MRNFPGKIKTSQKPKEVVRYFRKWDYKNEQIASSGGMTAICLLDYENMTLTIYPAFCSDSDNFNEAEGLKAANRNKERNAGFIFPLSREMTILENINFSIEEGNVFATNSYAQKNLTSHLERWYNSLWLWNETL